MCDTLSAHTEPLDGPIALKKRRYYRELNKVSRNKFANVTVMMAFSSPTVMIIIRSKYIAFALKLKFSTYYNVQDILRTIQFVFPDGQARTGTWANT